METTIGNAPSSRQVADPSYGLTAHIDGVDRATARQAVIDTLKEEGSPTAP